MRKTVTILTAVYTLVISFTLVCCNSNNKTHEVEKPDTKTNNVKVPRYSTNDSLIGTWISIRKSGFRMLEIPDSSNAIIYRLEKWRRSNDSINTDNTAYYKSKGKLTIRYECNLDVETDRFHFYFFKSNDTLFEMAEPGRVDTLIKVYNDSTISRPK